MHCYYDHTFSSFKLGNLLPMGTELGFFKIIFSNILFGEKIDTYGHNVFRSLVTLG